LKYQAPVSSSSFIHSARGRLLRPPVCRMMSLHATAQNEAFAIGQTAGILVKSTMNERYIRGLLILLVLSRKATMRELYYTGVLEILHRFSLLAIPSKSPPPSETDAGRPSRWALPSGQLGISGTLDRKAVYLPQNIHTPSGCGRDRPLAPAPGWVRC
jgi:hypothetical protein